MSKRNKENIVIIVLVVLLGIYFYFGIGYLDRYVLQEPDRIEKVVE